MRILYIINAFAYAGAEKLVYNLALRLAKRMEYIGIVALYARGDRTEDEMLEALRSAGIETRILAKKAGKDRLRSIHEIYRFAKQRRIHMLHAHCSVPMGLGKIVGKLINIPVVCTVHSINGYAIERATSWMVKAYISIGDAVEAYMTKELRIPGKKVFRIYNAVDVERFQNAAKCECFWEQYGGTPNDRAILNVARVSSPKNQLCLLRAFRLMVQWGNTTAKLYILGAYDEEDAVYRELAQYISENELAERVVFLGQHNNVEDFLANAECFVLTSRYEGFCVALLEAVVSGCPIVTTELPFVHELSSIADFATVVPQDDAEELAKVLMEARYQKQTERTVEVFSEKFSLERYADAHYDIYARIQQKRK